MSILNYSFQFKGSHEYHKIISTRSYVMGIKKGEGKFIKTNLANHIYSPSGKLPIKSPMYLLDRRDDNLRSSNYLGLFNDELTSRSAINNLYLDATLLIIMEITVVFNSEAVSGRVVDLRFATLEANLNTTLSGKWLIIQSQHKFEYHETLGKRAIVTQLTLGKNSFTSINDSWYFYNTNLKPKRSSSII